MTFCYVIDSFIFPKICRYTYYVEITPFEKKTKTKQGWFNILLQNRNRTFCEDSVATFCLIGVSLCEKLDYNTIGNQIPYFK